MLQDFWATMLLSNLETIVTAGAQKKIDAKVAASEGQLEQKINKAVSFNALKDATFEIFSSSQDKHILLDKLTTLFMVNTCVVRKNRDVPRKKASARRSVNFHKRQKKQVF